MYYSTDTKRLVVEIIANLAHIKSIMYERLLKPAGIRKEFFQSLLRERNDSGNCLTKREMANKIIFAIESHSSYEKIVHSIIKTACEWNHFHLANNEYEARATVQKAREVLGLLDIWREKEAAELKHTRNTVEAEKKVQQANELSAQLELLRYQYDNISGKSVNPQARGIMLEDIVNRLFNAYNLTEQLSVTQAFKRNDNGEQIDGAFKLDGWHYIVEMKWTNRVSGIRELDSLLGKISRSGKQTMGLFISINGWSFHVVELLKQNSDKSILLMNGYDLRAVLTGKIDLITMMHLKLSKLNLEAEPFYGAESMLIEDDD